MKIFAKGWSNDFDGPGRRFVYYLKGCNFNCLWCGSPESISSESEMLFYPKKSNCTELSCDKCAVTNNHLEREKCLKCSQKNCINIWHNPAFEYVGEKITKNEIIKEIKERRNLWGDNGGVTFSGGEPSLQFDELIDVALSLKTMGIHLTIETNASSPRLKKITEVFDLVICDLKSVTPRLHKKITGANNKTVLENISTAVKTNQEIIIRIPLIKELNFSLEEQNAFLDFFKEIKPRKIELLKLHKYGTPKYIAMNKVSPFDNMNPPNDLELNKFMIKFEKLNINVKIAN